MGISDQFRNKAEQLQRRAKDAMGDRDQQGRKKQKRKSDERRDEMTDRAKREMRSRQRRDR